MTMPDPDKDEAIGKLAQLADDERELDAAIDELLDRCRRKYPSMVDGRRDRMARIRRTR